MLKGSKRRSVDQSEEVLYSGRQHFVVLVWPIALLVIAAVADIFAIFVYTWLPIMIKFAGLVALIACGVYYVVAYLRYRTLELVVTSGRVVFFSGLFMQVSREIPLDRVAEIGVKSSLVQRILGMGTLRISSSGDDPDLSVPSVSEPKTLTRVLNGAIESRNHRAGGPSGRVAAPDSPIDKIAALGDLYKRGLLSKDEFEIAKAEQLRRL